MEIIKGIQYFNSPDIRGIRHLLDRSIQAYPHREAIVFRKTPKDEPIRKTYREVGQDVDALLTALLSRMGQGIRVGIVGDNSYAWMLAYLATASGLGLVIPLDRLLSPEELSSLLKRGAVDCLFIDVSLMENLTPFLEDCPDLKLCVGMQLARCSKADAAEAFKEAISALGKDYLNVEELLKEGYALSEDPEKLQTIDKPKLPRENEPAVLLYTSGTTAMSKGVLLSNKNLAADVRALIETVKFKDPLKSLSFLPLHHTFENTCGFLCVLALGGCIFIYDGLRYIPQNMKEYHVHILMGVPTVFEMFYRRVQQGIDKSGKRRAFTALYHFSNFLRFFHIDLRRKFFKDILDNFGGDFYIAIAGAAALNRDIIKFFDGIGIEILQGYGMTETSPVVAGCNTQYNVFGTCGQPLSGVTLAIDNKKAGESGEILIKGDMVMLGYDRDEASGEEVIDEDGWLHTGDIGYIQQKNHCLILTGRTKSMIVLPSGKKVFPEEIEALLNQNDYVRDSFIFGQEDRNGDIVLTAKIVLDQEKMSRESKDMSQEFIQKTIQEYIDNANKSLPGFKGIRSYAYSFQDLVKTTTMKVKRSVETERLKEILEHNKLSWKEFTGKNLDLLEAGEGVDAPYQASEGEGAPAEAEAGEESAEVAAAEDFQSFSIQELLEREESIREASKAQTEQLRTHYAQKMHEESIVSDRAVRIQRLAEKTELQLLQTNYQQQVHEVRARYDQELRAIKKEGRNRQDALMEEEIKAIISCNRKGSEDLTALHEEMEERRRKNPEQWEEEKRSFIKKAKREAKASKKERRQSQRSMKKQLKAERLATRKEAIEGANELRRKERELVQQQRQLKSEAKSERKDHRRKEREDRLKKREEFHALKTDLKESERLMKEAEADKISDKKADRKDEQK